MQSESVPKILSFDRVDGLWFFLPWARDFSYFILALKWAYVSILFFFKSILTWILYRRGSGKNHWEYNLKVEYLLCTQGVTVRFRVFPSFLWKRSQKIERAEKKPRMIWKEPIHKTGFLYFMSSSSRGKDKALSKLKHGFKSRRGRPRKILYKYAIIHRKKEGLYPSNNMTG